MHHLLIQMTVTDRASVECVPMERKGGGGERDKIRAEISAATDLPLVLLHTLDLLPK